MVLREEKIMQRYNPLQTLFENIQLLSNAENPMDETLYAKGSGRQQSAPNPYYNQIQAVMQFIPELRNKFNNFSQPGAIYNTPMPQGQLYQNSAQGEFDRMRGYRYFN